MVDRAQVQAFLLGYLSGQLGLLIVPDTLLMTWSQPAGKHTTMEAASPRRGLHHFLQTRLRGRGRGRVFPL